MLSSQSLHLLTSVLHQTLNISPNVDAPNQMLNAITTGVHRYKYYLTCFYPNLLHEFLKRNDFMDLSSGIRSEVLCFAYLCHKSVTRL